MHVVATAGHVDHGKSTLVRALTGQDPDRLEEERVRGLSIQLGYCWTHLPGAGEVAFVDVPGHERFLSTTLAGLGPVPAAMLVVAADDPWMPQAAEHLAALDLLGVRHGLVAVTRADLADPGPALRRAEEALAPTTLRDAECLAVSGRTGEGMDDLRAALVRLVAALPQPDPGADVRLWLDRAFHVRGAGTVVTGTLAAGTVRRGDALESGSGVRVRVRGVESLGQPVERAHGVARVALDLGGRADPSVGRGGVLVTPGAFEPTDLVDVRVRGEGQVPEQVLLHVGAAAVTVRARPLSADVLRLTLPERLPLRLCDRALLRDPGSRRLWGLTVLDPDVPPLERRRGAAARRAAALEDADGSVGSELRRRGAARPDRLRRLGATGEAPDGTLAAGAWLLDATRAEQVVTALPATVVGLGTPSRRQVAMPRLTAALGLPDDRLTAALVARVPGLRVRDGAVGPAGADLAPGLEAALAGIRADLTADPFAAPPAERLRSLGVDADGLAVLARAGLLLRVADTVVLLPGADDAATAVLATLTQPFTTSEARTALGTSRRVTLPLLAHLDRSGRTLRLPDDRRRVRWAMAE